MDYSVDIEDIRTSTNSNYFYIGIFQSFIYVCMSAFCPAVKVNLFSINSLSYITCTVHAHDKNENNLQVSSAIWEEMPGLGPHYHSILCRSCYHLSNIFEEWFGSTIAILIRKPAHFCNWYIRLVSTHKQRMFRFPVIILTFTRPK